MSKSFVFISQVFVPDPAAVGQYTYSAARELARRGNTVSVITADRGYEDPSIRYPANETIEGITVRRLPFSSSGKGSLLGRLAGQLAFCLLAGIVGTWMRRRDGVIVSTSPPMVNVTGLLISWLRGARLICWPMDLNPDQAVALGYMKASHPFACALSRLNRWAWCRATRIIAMDRFMVSRIAAELPKACCKTLAIPPWPHERELNDAENRVNPFRDEQGWSGKFVVMYSGNHSLAHPIQPILEVSKRMQDDERVLFAFIGGGKRKEEVEEFIRNERPPNVQSLPYQPLDMIRYSLSAADLHVVVMGESMVGIVHPCKVYGAMALAKPVLHVGPKESHIGDLMKNADFGWSCLPNDLDGIEAAIREASAMTPEEIQGKGRLGAGLIRKAFSESTLTARFAECVEAAIEEPIQDCGR